VTYHRFIAFGDHGTGSKDQQRVADAMAQRAASDGVDFMLTLGDNFYGSGVESVDDPQWKTKWENVYSAKSLQIPVYPTLGNHDHKGNVQAQIDYSKRNANWKMPSRYYTFRVDLDDGQHAQFFALDTDILGRADPKQAEWLERELKSSKAHWKIAFGHHPLYSHSKRFHNLRMIRHLEPVLRRYKVDLYVAGHDHILEMLKPVNGINYVVSGAGGGPGKAYEARWTESSHYAATLGGFCLFRLSKTELVIEFVRMNGKTQYAHTLYKGRLGPF
jgi:acid phosphatase